MVSLVTLLIEKDKIPWLSKSKLCLPRKLRP